VATEEGTLIGEIIITAVNSFTITLEQKNSIISVFLMKASYFDALRKINSGVHDFVYE